MCIIHPDIKTYKRQEFGFHLELPAVILTRMTSPLVFTVLSLMWLHHMQAVEKGIFLSLFRW